MPRKFKRSTRSAKTTRPMTAKSRKTYKRRSYRPKRRITGPFKAYVANDPFPPQRFCKLRYTGTYTFTVGTSGVFGTEQIWRLNSLYDPDYSGTGHQPYGFDQMAALYDNYIVNAVHFTLTAIDPSQDGLAVGYLLNDSLGPESIQGKALDEVKERPMAVVRYLSDSGKQQTTVKQYFRISTIDGVSRTTHSAQIDQYGAAVNANPALTPYLRAGILDTRNGSAGSVVITAQFTYYCKFFNRKILAQS